MFYIRGTCRLYAELLRLFMRFDNMGRKVSISPCCDIRHGAAPYIYLGDSVKIEKDVWLNIPYEAAPPVKGRPVIRIGDGTSIGRRCMISGMNCIEIGSNVLFGPGVFVSDHSHEHKNFQIPVSRQGTTEAGRIIIEDGCWFGYHSVIITHKGRDLRIGRNSAIGANAVVTKSFPEHSVLIGNPARNIDGRRQE